MRPFSMTDDVDAPRSSFRVPRNQCQTAGPIQLGYHFDQASPAPGRFNPSRLHPPNSHPPNSHPPNSHPPNSHPPSSHPISVYPPPSNLPPLTEHQSTSHLHFTSTNNMVPQTMGINSQGDNRDSQYHRGSVYYTSRNTPQYPIAAQPNMADYSSTNNWNDGPYYLQPTAQQPLANSMYAVATNDQISFNPQMVSGAAEMSQLEQRVDKVERQQLQEGLNAQFDHISTARSLQGLQSEVLQLKRTIEDNIPELRQTIITLKAKLDGKENEKCTRLIKIEPRTQEEKLESAMKNASLERIASGTAMPSNLTPAEVSIRGAEQMESLARTLRSRVHKGGAAYILEAEDAEAWAANLRDSVSLDEHSAKPRTPPEQRNMLTVEMMKKYVTDDNPKMLEKHNNSSWREVVMASLSLEVVNVNPQEHTQAVPAEEALDEKASGSLTVVEAPPKPKSASNMEANSMVQEAGSLTITAAPCAGEKASVKVPAIRASKPAPHRRHASEHTEVSRLSASESAVTVKVEESSISDNESLQAIPKSKVQSPFIRGRKWAPHHKLAAQQAQVPEPSIHETELEISEVITSETETEVAESLIQELEIEVPDEKILGSIVQTPEATEPVEVAEVTEITEVANIMEVPATPEVTGVQVPVTRANKPAPHHRHVVCQVEASKLSEVEKDDTKEEEAAPCEAEEPKSEVMQEEQDQPSAQVTATDALPQDDLEPKKEVLTEPSEGDIQDVATQTDLNVTAGNSTWQPTYLKALPSLHTEELEVIPSSDKMHHFNRSFILSHLGGIRWLPSFYCVPEPERSLLPNRGFFLLEDIHEPLGPSIPGTHGSLLAPIIRLPEPNNSNTPKPEAMQNAPLFVKQSDGYVFCGMYTYLRADRLDIERCDAVVPGHLKTFWAEELTSAQRPKWVTDALQKHMLPPPTYSGPLSGQADEDQVSAALGVHMTNHEAWHRDTHFKTAFLRPEHILSAFSAPDTGAEMPGIRFWNLGLKCEGWDKEFYDMMVREEGIWEKEGSRDGEAEREREKEMMRMLRPRSKRPKKW